MSLSFLSLVPVSIPSSPRPPLLFLDRGEVEDFGARWVAPPHVILQVRTTWRSETGSETRLETSRKATGKRTERDVAEPGTPLPEDDRRVDRSKRAYIRTIGTDTASETKRVVVEPRVRSRGFQDRTHLRHVRSRGDRSVRSSTKSIGFDGTGVRFVHDGTSRRCVRDPVRGRRSCTVLSCREGSYHEPLRGSEIRLDSTTGLGSRWDPSPCVFGLDFFVRPGPSAPRLRGRFPTGDLRSPRGGYVPRSHPVGRISNEWMGWEGWRERIRVG